MTEEENRKKKIVLDLVKEAGLLREKFNADIEGISERLIEQYQFKTIFGKTTEIIYSWNGKYYEPKGREIIKKEAEEILGSFAKTKIVNEIYEKIKRKTIIPKEEFEALDCDLIPFENGVYSIKEKKLYEHSPKYNFTFIIPNSYENTIKCERFMKFLQEVVSPDDIPLIQELFGFCLYRKYFIKKGFIFRGEPDTSKTTLLNILIEWIGGKNKTSIPLQKISGTNDFTKLSLKGKLLNVYDDLSAKDLEDSAGFKIATGGGYISAEEKFGDYTQFMNYAKQLFATNKIPPIKQKDDNAYYGRWIVIEFENVVTNPDSFILQKILSPEELSGITNWALEGLHRLLERGKFSYEKSLEEIKLIMEKASGEGLASFICEMLQPNEAGRISKEDMHLLYTSYAEINKLPKLSKEQIGRQLPKRAKYILDKRDNERYWAGVSIREFNNYKNNDTLDTFYKHIRRISKVINDMPNNASILSEENSVLDTLDTSKVSRSNEKQVLDTLDTSKEKNYTEQELIDIMTKSLKSNTE